MAPSSKIALAAVATAMFVGACLQWRSQRDVAAAGFWFENVTFELPHLQARGLGGPLTTAERELIERTARAELGAAFSAMRLVISDDRQARFRAVVVQQYPPTRYSAFGAAGQSWGISGFGGTATVNFLMLGSLAIAHAPPGTGRAAIVEGIGRGIGRSAVHELTHLLVPTAPIHDSRDKESYEFASAARPSQFYGPMRWDLARPILLRRFGTPN